MPKLDKATAADVQNVESFSGEYALIEPGKYVATLNGVEVRDGNHGGTQWSAEFGNIETLTGSKISGRQWLNLNIVPKGPAPASYTNGQEKWDAYVNVSFARLKSFFEAFGYTTDSDTDEMIGERALITIEIRTIQNGPKRGQQVNGIKSVEALPAGATTAGAGDDEAF